MFCEQCGAQVPDGMSFCDQCGAPLMPVNIRQGMPQRSDPYIQQPMQQEPMHGMQQGQPTYMGESVPPVYSGVPKKSPLVPIIIVIAAVFVLGIGGFGVYKNIDKIKDLIGKEKSDEEPPEDIVPTVTPAEILPEEITPTLTPPEDIEPTQLPSDDDPFRNEPSDDEQPGMPAPTITEETKSYSGDKNSNSSDGKNSGLKSSGSGNVTITDIVEMARVKSGAPNAELDSIDPDGTLNIRLFGNGTQDTWDWYYIDPDTLKGTNITGDPVSLN